LALRQFDYESEFHLHAVHMHPRVSRYNTSVNDNTVKRLLALNRQFYQTFALQFSQTRGRLQPGVVEILKRIPAQARILDLGCGNGEFWRALKRQGHKGLYVGMDFSDKMIAEASQGGALRVKGLDARPKDGNTLLMQADLSTEDWNQAFPEETFDIAVAFAVLHHLPSQGLRHRTQEKIHHLLVSAGKFIHSEWQFLNSPRLRARIQPWHAINLSEADVDPGDYLLDWRRGGLGLRYVHHFDEQELARLANETGFDILETFYSDGQGGDLALYQIWEVN
jgi:tRNA (uracil-5-)-methyltransferase TRM9